MLESITSNLHSDLYVVYFFLYSLVGYICEVTYCSIPAKHFVNRGFLFGPYLPIYGFGAMIVLVGFSHLVLHPWAIFLTAMVSTSILEYVTSWMLQRFFNVKLWDYSKYFCNINGRVCLLNSTLFGIMGLVVTYFVHPQIATLVIKIPFEILTRISKVIIFVMTIDATASVFKMAAFRNELAELRQKGKMFQERLDLLKLPGSENMVATFKAKFLGDQEELKERFRKQNRRILDAFPSMTSANEEVRLQLNLFKMELRSRYEKHARGDK
ncbi:MAG: putative ABC transporter permease [Sphaerochaetaceae bacterium]